MGTILPYKGSISNIPEKWALCNGMNGTPNLTGRFLEGVTSSPGSMKSAGLPNITGHFRNLLRQKDYGIFASGAIYIDDTFKNNICGTLNQIDIASMGDSINFDASRCSSVYKDDCTTVQPASYTVLYIMKIKA